MVSNSCFPSFHVSAGTIGEPPHPDGFFRLNLHLISSLLSIKYSARPQEVSVLPFTKYSQLYLPSNTQWHVYLHFSSASPTVPLEWVHCLSGLCQPLQPHSLITACQGCASISHSSLLLTSHYASVHTGFFSFLSWPCCIFSSSVWMFFVLLIKPCFQPQLKDHFLQEIFWFPCWVWSKHSLHL